jgi:hypothetical protein
VSFFTDSSLPNWPLRSGPLTTKANHRPGCKPVGSTPTH